ncbi:MAG: site-2 protease family protein [Anaerolineae bacterium]|nr:site-2 protease family protein [Anaerolineae bacterium]
MELTIAAALRQELDGLFVALDTAYNQPEEDHFLFRGQFLCAPLDCYDELRRRFERHGYTPLIRREGNDTMIVAIPAVFRPSSSRWQLNLLLFVLTVLATLLTGAAYHEDFTGQNLLREIWLGWPFSLSLLGILGAHEMGHYIAARYHGAPVTLPYFIPFPLSPIGTMGAIIRLKAPLKNRRALLDMGVAGPLAGMAVAIPVLLYGLATSDIGPPPSGIYYQEGNSILYGLFKLLIFGRWLPSGGLDVQLNMVAWAGWVGMLVTALNLIPVGQLDGGHILYTLLGRRAAAVFWPAILILISFALFYNVTMWWVWGGLLFLLGRQYAVPLDDVTRLDRPRRLLALFALVLFILIFMPDPLQVVQ